MTLSAYGGRLPKPAPPTPIAPDGSARLHVTSDLADNKGWSFFNNQHFHTNMCIKPGKPENRIRFCRMLSNYSQKELAGLLDVPTLTLSRWENWSQEPSLYHAIGVAVALHRLVDEIFSDYREEWVAVVNERAKKLEKIKGLKIANDNDKR